MYPHLLYSYVPIYKLYVHKVFVLSLIPEVMVNLFSLCTYLFGISVTRLGDLLDFGELFKAFGNN